MDRRMKIPLGSVILVLSIATARVPSTRSTVASAPSTSDSPRSASALAGVGRQCRGALFSGGVQVSAGVSRANRAFNSGEMSSSRSSYRATVPSLVGYACISKQSRTLNSAAEPKNGAQRLDGTVGTPAGRPSATRESAGAGGVRSRSRRCRVESVHARLPSAGATPISTECLVAVGAVSGSVSRWF